MDSKDVKRGNVVIYEGKYYKIDSISEEYPTLDTIEFGIGVVEWKDLQPVLITKDVLEKNLGFVKTFSGEYFDRYTSKLYKAYVFNLNKPENEIKLYLLIKNIPDLVNFENIKYMHQLQNLCRLTENKELNFEI
jgi:hypothetical protein